jgi:hypothetical protein
MTPTKRSIYDQTHDEVYLAAALLMRLPLGPFLDAVSQIQVEGPIQDPRKYLAEMPRLTTTRQIAGALARAQNEIRAALALHGDGRAQLALFEQPGRSGPQSVRYHMDRLAVAALASGLEFGEILREAERQCLINLLIANGGVKTRAAAAAGMHRNTLDLKLKEHGIFPMDYGRRRRYKATAKRSGAASVTPRLFLRGDSEVAG